MKTSQETKIRTRDYRPEDFESLSELWELSDLSPPERDDSAETIKICNEKGGRLLVMEDIENGKIIGSSWMTSDGRRIFMHHFGILPDYRGKGFGTELANISLDWIRQQGQQEKLEVHKDNHPAKRIYEKLGFFAFRDYVIYMIRDFAQ